jgi:hypothetical protein
MVLRLMARSSWRRIPLASIAAGLMAERIRLDSIGLRQLDTSHGCQNHTLLPYASASFVCRAADRSQAKARPAILPAQRALPRPPHSDPTSVTIAIRPSWRAWNGRGCKGDLGEERRDLFLSGWLDEANHPDCVEKISVLAHALTHGCGIESTLVLDQSSILRRGYIIR